MKFTSMHDTYTMNNGNKIPCMGFGTYIPSAREQVHKEMIKTAIEVGYRYFDTASLYGSERALGEAIIESGIDRKEFFIATKVWHDELDEVGDALNRSLERMQMDYVDLYLCHWPRRNDDDNWKERGRKAWSDMETGVEKGMIKNIGFSNFLPHHADNILKDCKIKPVVDQLELHPGCSQAFARAYLKEQGIIAQAWSPLARGAADGQDSANRTFFESLAKKYGKSIQQILIRFQIDCGVIPIIKSMHADRMKANADVFDFELEQEDIWMLECMPQNTWLGEHPDFHIPTAKSNREQ